MIRARPASSLGVDIVQNCEVLDFLKIDDRIAGVRTSRGEVRADRIGIAAAGHNSVLAKLAGFRLPVTSYELQAMLSERVKPALDTVVLSAGTGAYISQSDKGEMAIGAGLDLFASYAQRGSFSVMQQIVAGTLELFPLVQPVAAAEAMGGHRRCGAGLQPDHRRDPSPSYRAYLT